ncbi:MAG: transglycosylase SLT domain-containing protein [Lewinellaceae bacterium]|nr:transglycosylase SLT domain-containing protein [Phaeodactylibacter sp.]MCB9038415.1 transglycosylase SLT domain-containing protein [Lewinellaceae bacterium]
MKIPWTIVALLAASCLFATNKKAAFPLDASASVEYHWSAKTNGDIRDRLAQLKIPFEARYDNQVRDIIKDYVTNGLHDTESMLGRTSFYFPIFEHYLSLYGLPKELKYLPIVETSLEPVARSGAGAAGLWQFIPATAREYRLRMNEYVDERYDPYRSTEAAVKMLSALHKQFKDWSLVLAAYNCGPGRVRSAIRAAGCYDFWELRPYLPQETQDYVPRFIAAAYVANFYNHHGLQPRFSRNSAEQGRAVKIYNSMTFGDIAYVTGVEERTIRQFNPSYKRNIIPNSQRGNFLLLPAPAMRKLRDHLLALKGGEYIDPVLLYPNFHKSTYVVKPGEDLYSLTRKFHCTADEIMRWNALPTPEIFVNQELMLFLQGQDYAAKP